MAKALRATETIDLAFDPSLPREMAKVASLVVTAKKQRWRAGRAFGPVETVIPLADLSAEQIVAITGDRLLTVLVRAPKPPAD
jgi:hypothetical protein